VVVVGICTKTAFYKGISSDLIDWPGLLGLICVFLSWVMLHDGVTLLHLEPFFVIYLNQHPKVILFLDL
jgi:hypothetical protein